MPKDSAQMRELQDEDWTWLLQLHNSIATLAEPPQDVLRNMRQLNISVPQVHADILTKVREIVIAKYPSLAQSSLLKAVSEVVAICTRKMSGSDQYEKDFWTNKGFKDHPEWSRIRTIARAFLLK